MSPDDPRHGSPGGRMRHWRDGESPCDPCTLAGRRADKAVRLDRHRGQPRMVELGEEAWRVIHDTPRDQLSRACGVSVHRLCTYDVRGPDRRVHRTTRDRILAAGGHDYWTPVGIQRRLRALAAIGWSMREIARRTGLDADGLKRLRRREVAHYVRRNVALGVVAIYEELSMSPAPAGRSATKTVTLARRDGYAPPLAWENIDDPAEVPTSDTRDRRYSPAELVEEWVHLRRAGVSMDVAADRLGLTTKAIEKALQRAGRAA